ncbi:MAG: 5-oxoprolinase subunit PxpA [Halioglobus sp.]
MLLNCDLGESYGNWTMGNDAAVMPYIDQASIACGFHAGDPLCIRRTLALAAEHGVTVGAHPAYPDLVGFGRRSMALSTDEIIASVHYQVAALDGMAQSLGLSLQYIKPHGALYHDVMANSTVRTAMLQAVASYHRPLALIVQASAQANTLREEAAAAEVTLWFEAFADRCYVDDGNLLPRSQPLAVHSRERMLAQVAQLQDEQAVTTISGNTLHLQFDTLCVHGDNPEGVASIAAIRALLSDG